MNDITITASLGDARVLAELGRRIELHRLQANLTQAALAREAGVSKRTLERLEATGACQLASLVRVLRALGLLDHLELALPAPLPSPMALLQTGGSGRQRASGRRKASSRKAPGSGQPHSDEPTLSESDGDPWQWQDPPQPESGPDEP